MEAPKLIVVSGKSGAARKAERRRSRIVLTAIIVTAVVVPTAATALFLGSDRLRGYAVLALAILFVGLGFLALFRRPLPKSQQSPGESPPTQYTGFDGR